jgi:hypothetical protein
MSTAIKGQTRAYCVVVCPLMSALLACGSGPEPGSGGAGQTHAATQPPEGAGFVHTANNSRFRLGASPTQKLEFGLAKVVGSEGVFATVPETGWVLAIPNSRSPATVAEPSLSRSLACRSIRSISHCVRSI